MKVGMFHSLGVIGCLTFASCAAVPHQTKPVTVAVAVSTKRASAEVASAKVAVAVASKKIDETRATLVAASEAAGRGETVDWATALAKSNASLLDARVSLSSATDSLTTTTNELSVVQTKADFLQDQNAGLVKAYTERDREATKAEAASTKYKTVAQSRARWVAVWATTSAVEFVACGLLAYLLLRPGSLL